MKSLSAIPLAGLLLLAGEAQDGGGGGLSQDASEQVAAALAASGLQLDLEAGLLGVPATVLIRDDLLEYLLVGPGGASHESLLLTGVRPSLINAALLALGVEPGQNASWTTREPAPTEEERAAGVDPYEVRPPAGDSFSLYLGWREGEESYLFRVEDLLANLASGRSMGRHRWVYLGSRFVPGRDGETEVFAADLAQNLINIAWFYEGNTLLSSALEACRDQEIWTANSWLVPPAGSTVQLILARGDRVSLPEGWREALPRIDGTVDSAREPAEMPPGEDPGSGGI